VLLPGRLTSWKGQEVFIEAINLVNIELGYEAFYAVILGSDQGRDLYKKKLIRLSEQYRLSKQIRFIDHCKDMALAYKVSDIIVSASIEPEAFGRVAVVAQSMEKPCIASNIGGSNETIIDEKYIEISILGFDFKLRLALTTVIMFEIWRYFPLAFLFILARLQAIPKELYEAADVDGASPFQKFFNITLPQITAVISILFMIRFIWNFNKLEDVFLLTGGASGTRTLPINVYQQGFAISDIGMGSAVSIVIVVLLLMFMFFYFKLLGKRVDEN